MTTGARKNLEEEIRIVCRNLLGGAITTRQAEEQLIDAIEKALNEEAEQVEDNYTGKLADERHRNQALETELERLKNLVNHCGENHDWVAWNKQLNKRQDKIEELESKISAAQAETEKERNHEKITHDKLLMANHNIMQLTQQISEARAALEKIAFHCKGMACGDIAKKALTEGGAHAD